ncbi:hypothetical protein BH10PLA1_BH10PLA1_09810 [soil metagenome]
MKFAIVSAILLFGTVGCASEATSRKFDVSFETADTKLRSLYPPVLLPAAPKSDANVTITIKRDELSKDGQERIVLSQIEPQPSERIEITLDSAGSGCEVSVQVSKSKKSVVFPSRDQDEEIAVLERIANALK